MSTRNRLPDRRPHEIIEFDLEGVTFVAGIGRFEDGTLGEVFFHSAGKSGSAVERFAQDAGVLASLAFQHGTTISEMRHSLVKLKDGSGAGPVGKLLNLIEAGREQHG